jgi:hypothetical protein
MAQLRMDYKEVNSRRLTRFSVMARVSKAEAIGLLLLFWHDTEHEGVLRETREVLAQYVTASPADCDNIIGCMIASGYLIEEAEMTYFIEGNAERIGKLEANREKGRHGARVKAAMAQAAKQKPVVRKRRVLKASPPEPAPSAPVAVVKADTDTPFKAACREASLAYVRAVEQKTGQLPIRNAKYHSQMQQVVKRLGTEACTTLQFYVNCNTDPAVMRSLWPLGTFLSQAESIAMQAKMGRYISLDDAKAFSTEVQYRQRQQDILEGRA